MRQQWHNANACTVLLLTLKGERRNLCGAGKLMTQGKESDGTLEQNANAATTACVSSALPSPFAPKSMIFNGVEAKAELSRRAVKEARRSI